MKKNLPSREGQMNIELTFGALAPDLRDQLKRQGIKPPPYTEQWQKQDRAITLLAIHGLLTDAERTRCRRRLMKDIVSQVAKGEPK